MSVKNMSLKERYEEFGKVIEGIEDWNVRKSFMSKMFSNKEINIIERYNRLWRLGDENSYGKKWVWRYDIGNECDYDDDNDYSSINKVDIYLEQDGIILLHLGDYYWEIDHYYGCEEWFEKLKDIECDSEEWYGILYELFDCDDKKEFIDYKIEGRINGEWNCCEYLLGLDDEYDYDNDEVSNLRVVYMIKHCISYNELYGIDGVKTVNIFRGED